MTQKGVGARPRVYFSDEMWLGLRDQERVLTPPEAKVVQKVQSTDTYGYLLLAVDPLRGEFRWQCVERMRAEHLLPVP